MPRLEVTTIEFEFSNEILQIRSDFFLCLKRYASKAISELKTDTQNKKVIFKFDRAISLNTVNNAISAFLNKNNIKINEIEYKLDKKKVEIEVK